MQVAITSTFANLGLSSAGDIEYVTLPWFNGHAFNYRRYYTQRARNDKRFTILDNGAWEENRSAPAAQLLEAVRVLDPQEVVAPDILKDGTGTFIQTVEFLLENVWMHTAEDLEAPRRVMVVPQGKTLKEWQRRYADTVNMCEALGVTSKITVGVPKWLDWLNEDQTRLEVLDRMQAAGDLAIHLPHHLLGGGRRPLREVINARTQEYIRSIDTSVPVALGLAGIDLTEDTVVEMNRFDPTANLVYVEVAKNNVKKYVEAAHGDKRTQKDSTPKEAPKSEQRPQRVGGSEDRGAKSDNTKEETSASEV